VRRRDGDKERAQLEKSGNTCGMVYHDGADNTDRIVSFCDHTIDRTAMSKHK